MRTYGRLHYRIPFSETDAMSVVHHSNHARYLERGRVELLRLAGLDYAGLMRRGMQYPVLELRTVFRRPLLFDQVIAIETWVSSLTRTRLSFSYKIFPAEELAAPALSEAPLSGPPSALGETFHCCVNGEGRPIEASADVLARLRELSGETA